MHWYEILSTVGFPIFVACYLLFKHDKAIRDLTRVIRELLIYLKGKNGE